MRNKSARYYINIARITFLVTLVILIAFRLGYALTHREIWILYSFFFLMPSTLINLILFIYLNLANTDRDKDKAVLLNSLLLLLNTPLTFLFPLIF